MEAFLRLVMAVGKTDAARIEKEPAIRTQAPDILNVSMPAGHHLGIISAEEIEERIMGHVRQDHLIEGSWRAVETQQFSACIQVGFYYRLKGLDKFTVS